MERMLDVVRHRCAQIFKYTAELQAEIGQCPRASTWFLRDKRQEGSESEVEEESEHHDEHEDEFSSRPFSTAEFRNRIEQASERMRGERQSVAKTRRGRVCTLENNDSFSFPCVMKAARKGCEFGMSFTRIRRSQENPCFPFSAPVRLVRLECTGAPERRNAEIDRSATVPSTNLSSTRSGESEQRVRASREGDASSS